MADKPLLIVDASVLLKFYLDEQDIENALMIKNQYICHEINIIEPEYAFSEIFNIMAIFLDKKEALSAYSNLLSLGFMKFSVTLELASIAAELMNKYKGISFYDAGYHALALKEGGTFVTADEKYYKKTRRAGGIILLKNYRG